MVPNLDIFVFFAKFSNHANPRVLISNMTIFSLKILVQKYLIKVFLVPNLAIFVFFFLQNFAFRQIRLCWFQIWQYFFKKFQLKNTQIRHFWCQIQPFWFFCEILQLDKFKGADFNYGNSFFKIPAQKYPNKAFLVPNLDIFGFFTKSCP